MLFYCRKNTASHPNLTLIFKLKLMDDRPTNSYVEPASPEAIYLRIPFARE